MKTDPTGTEDGAIAEHGLCRPGRFGEVRAAVSDYGASLRTLNVGGVDLVEPYPVGSAPPLAAGIVLVPWPNRVDHGRWTWRGQLQQLSITEPERDTALHGLLAGARYRTADRSVDAVMLTAAIPTAPGYPFRLDTSVRYRLTDDGIGVEHHIVNRGTDPAPVAVGAHPYLRVGTAPLDRLVLTIPAQRRLILDDRYLPTGAEPVPGTRYDLRSGVRVTDAPTHAGYTDLTPSDGLIRHTLVAPEHPDGPRTVELWADPAFGYTQLYRTPDFPGPDGPRSAIAMEPMTAPANALRSGEGLRWLDPGESWRVGWGLRLRLGEHIGLW